MKITILSVALISAMAMSACAKDEPAVDTAAADTAAMQAEPAADAMEPVPAETMPATENPMVGGAAMMADMNIIDNAMNSKDHTTLVAAVTAAGLVDTLKGAGPFTVFAPTNAAFDALPAGTVDGLMKPDMKADLSKVLTYHVVPGNLDAAALMAQIQAGGGKAMLTTVQGGQLTATLDGNSVKITDGKGNVATVTTADVRQSNGVIHVVDKVLMPS